MNQDEQIELAIECGANYVEFDIGESIIPFYTSELAAYTAAVEAKEREKSANALKLNNSELMLMAGEMSAQELRTVNAVLGALQLKIRSLINE